MFASTLSKGLLVLGALVGGAAGIALALGLGPEHIPRWMVTVGMYKLAFIAAAGLLTAGALVGRAARNRLRERQEYEGPRRRPGDRMPT